MYTKVIIFNVNYISLFYWFFCLEYLSIDTSGVLKSPTIIVFLSVSPFMSVSMFYIFWCSYVGCIYVDKYNILSLYRSFYHYIVSFVIFVLKSILSDMSIVTLAFLSFLFARKIFFHALIFNLCVSFALKCVPCKQHIVGSSFFIQSATLCHFFFLIFKFYFIFFIQQVLVSHQFYTHQCINVNHIRPVHHTTIPTPCGFPPLVPVRLFSTSVSQLLFCKPVICTIFLGSTYMR